MDQYRQGDVLIERIAKKDLPKTAKPIPRDRGRIILAYGEATGHAHIAKGDNVQLMAVKASKADELTRRYLVVGKGGARVVHDEHQPIALRPGVHRVARQREYVPPKRAETRASHRPVYD